MEKISSQDAQVASDTKPLALSRILAFSTPSLALAALGLPFVIQLPPHYTNYVGLSLGTVGALFMAARLFDVFVDLGLGLMMDQTRTKIGRFTPWLLCAAPIMSIFVWFLFMAKPGASATYLGLALFGTYVLFSTGTLAQLGIGNSLSNNYYERSKVFSFWQVGNIIGMLLVLSIPAIVEARGGTAADGVHSMGLFIIIMMPLSAIVSFMFAKEKNNHAVPQKSDIQDFKALLGLQSFKKLMQVDFIVSFASGVTGGLFLYFLAAIKGYGDKGSLLLLSYFVSGLVFTILWVKLSKKLGKHIALRLAIAFLASSQILVLFMPENNLTLALILVAIAGVAYAAPLYLVRSMVADVGDEDKLATKKERSGLLFAMVTLTSKIGYALSVGITYPLLQWFGFDPKLGETNTASAMFWFQIVYIGFPVICHITIIAILKSYPLTQQRVAEVQAELAKLDA